MKTVDLAAERLSLEEALSLAEQDNLILRLPSGREFVLAELDDFDQEVELVRQHSQLRSFLADRSREQSRLTLEQVKASLGLS